ncbi:MAG: tetratricopeptide repeat protein [Planctomycetes bacterium]|nr:tetratricopeptide repeat protein [Planctomycetota bacterium]
MVPLVKPALGTLVVISLLALSPSLLAQGDAPASSPASAPAQAAPSDPESLRRAGAELLRLGRKDEAIASFRAAWEADKSLDSVLGLFRALMADGRLNDALNALDDAEKLHNKKAGLHVAYAEGFAAQAARMARDGAKPMEYGAQYEEAARSMEAAAELEPKEASHHAGVIRYLLYAGKTEEACEVAKRARAAVPQSWEVAMLEGDAISQHLAYNNQLRAASGAAEGSEEQKEAEKARAAALADAEKAYSEAAKLDESRAEPRERIGALWLQTGKERDKAVEQYLLALERAPLAVTLAPVLQGMSPKEMLTFFEQALARFEKRHPGLAADAPDDSPLHWYLGFSRLQTDDRKGAAEAFERAARKNPHDASARYYLGKIAYSDQAFDKAIAHFDTLAKQSPKMLADVGRQDGRFWPMMQGLIGKLIGAESGATSVAAGESTDIAIRFELALLEIDPRNTVEMTNVALFYRDSNRPKEALAMYKRALDLNPTDARILNDTAVIYHYYLKSDDAEAERLYDLSIARSKEIIESKKASQREKEDARSALTDASGNLARLKAGNRRNN